VSPEGREAIAPLSEIAGRKVRAPQGRMLGNAQAGKPDGKYHRKHTAFFACAMEGKGEKVR